MQQSKRRGLFQRIMAWIRGNARVEVVLPVVVAVGLLGYVMSVAVAPRSGAELWTVIQQTWLLMLILTIPYLAARIWVWNQLLLQLGFRIPWRQLAASFAVGEMTKSMPAGVYTQNYLLSRLNHFSQVSAVRSTMATTAMLGLETLIALPVVLILGIPGAPWVFWSLVAIVGIWLALLAAAWFLTHYAAHRLSRDRHPWLQRISMVVAEFLDAGAELVGRRTALSLLPTLVYMLVYVVDLQLIIRALGIHNVPFLHTMAIYAVIVLAVVLIPIPTELGITEFTGLSALQAYGVPGSMAAVVLLSLRLLATGMTILVAGALLLTMRGELRQRETRPPESAAGEATAYQ